MNILVAEKCSNEQLTHSYWDAVLLGGNKNRQSLIALIPNYTLKDSHKILSTCYFTSS